VLGVAATVRDAEAMLVTPAESGDIVRITAATRACLGDRVFEAEFARGIKLTPEEAFALVR
jgi:hypothetical protein